MATLKAHAKVRHAHRQRRASRSQESDSNTLESRVRRRTVHMMAGHTSSRSQRWGKVQPFRTNETYCQCGKPLGTPNNALVTSLVHMTSPDGSSVVSWRSAVRPTSIRPGWRASMESRGR